MGTDNGSDGIHRELSHAIIGAAMRVLNELKPGLDEKLYENALVIELRKRGLAVEQQKTFPVYYDGQLVGRLIPDLIVDEKVVVAPKVAEGFSPTHMAQMSRLSCDNRVEARPLAQLQGVRAQDEACHPRLIDLCESVLSVA
jgi:GxxExxY protein